MSAYALTQERYSNSKFLYGFDRRTRKHLRIRISSGKIVRGTELFNGNKCPVDVIHIEHMTYRSRSIIHVRMVFSWSFARCVHAHAVVQVPGNDVHLVTAGDVTGGFPIRGAINLEPSIGLFFFSFSNFHITYLPRDSP